MDEVIKALEVYDKAQRAKGSGQPAIRFPMNRVAAVFDGGTQLAIPVSALIEELKQQFKA